METRLNSRLILNRLKIVKMEVDNNTKTIKRYQVVIVPALRLIRGDELLESTEGAICDRANFRFWILDFRLGRILNKHLTPAPN